MTFALASTFSLLTSIDFTASLKEYKSIFLLLIFYLFAQNLKADKKAYIFLDVLVVFSTIAGAYGIFQHLTGSDFLGHYQDRSTGFFSLYLTFAEYMVMVLCICIGQLVYRLSLKRRLLLSGGTLIMLAGLIVSWSRGPWLAFAAAMAFLAFLRSWKLCVILAIVAVLLFSIFYFFDLGKISMLVRSIFTLKEGEDSVAEVYLQSNLERLAMWRSGFHILADSPQHLLTGIGMHALEKRYPQYREEWTPHPNLWHLHSNFMQILITRGLLGLAAFFWIFGAFFKYGLKHLRIIVDARRKGIMLGITAAVVGFLLSGLTEYSWGDTEVLMLLYCLMGIGLVLSRKTQKSTVSKESF